MVFASWSGRTQRGHPCTGVPGSTAVPFPSSMGEGLLRPLQRLFFSGCDTLACQLLCCPCCAALAVQ